MSRPSYAGTNGWRHRPAGVLLRPMSMARRALPSSWRRLAQDERHHRGVVRKLRALVAARTPLPPSDSAKAAGLRYVSDQRMPGIRRIGAQRRFRYAERRFRYVDVHGRTVADRAVLQRIRSLAIPP